MEPHDSLPKNKLLAPDTKDRILFKSRSSLKQEPTTWWRAMAQVHTPPGALSVRPTAPWHYWKQKMLLRDALSHSMEQLSIANRDKHG